MISLPACRRLLFPTKEIGDVWTQASDIKVQCDLVFMGVNLSYSCGWCKDFEFWRLLEKKCELNSISINGPSLVWGKGFGELNVPISVDCVRASRYE